MKVLVVEDELDLLTLLERYLTHYCDCEVTTAEDGQKGWDLFNKSPNNYELVITDINMPKLDGLSLVKRINNVDSIPIICITGHFDLEVDAKNSGLNIVAVLTKPFSLKELDCLISNIMSRKKL
jgi:DNA-binding response OmpR family regulator